ncbi:MAG: hypothetical protein QXT19_05160 [Candidatus Woesearchaeota archaeon]
MKLAVPFELRIFLVVVLIGLISILVILDVPEKEITYGQMSQFAQIQTTSKIIQGLQQPGEPTNTLVISGIDIGQPIGYKRPSITGNEFACMMDRKITTNAGRTTVRYTLLLRDPTAGGFNGCRIEFGQTEQDITGLFMRCPSTEDMLAFIIEFDSGLRSELKDGELEDILEKDLPILGAMYTIVRAEANTADRTVALRLMGPAGTLDMQDQYDDNLFSQYIRANGQNIMEGRVRIRATYDGRIFSINSIEYRFTPIAIASGDVYVPSMHGTKHFLRTPAGFLGDFDILFRGLGGSLPKTVSPPKKTYPQDLESSNVIAFDSAGNVKYNMKFTNNRGQYYKFPVVYDTGAGLKWGDQSKNFVFFGAPIMPNDIFAVTNGNNKRGITNIVEYSSINTDEQKVYFKDLGGKNVAAPYDPATGAGDVILGGNHYAFVVNPAPPHQLLSDHDGNGAVGGKADIVTSGGIRVILNPAAFTGQVYVESSLFAEGGGPETISFAFSPGINVDITGGVQMLYNDATDMNEGLSGFGIFVQQTTKKDTGRNLKFNLPGGQVGAKVKVAAPVASVGGQAQGEVYITCERSEFVKAQMAAQSQK